MPAKCARGDGMSSVTKQVKKYGNKLKIRDSERFAALGSLMESLSIFYPSFTVLRF